MPEHTTTENTPTHGNSIEWKLMSTNKDRVVKPTPIQQFQPQPIPTIINRYSIPDNLNLHSQIHQPCEQVNNRLLPKEKVNRIIESARAMQQIKRRDKCNKKTSDKKQNKIIIIGDSHARGCAQELQHKLGHGFQVQGFVKPAANLQTIVNTSPKTMGKLTKKDVVVLWGGTRDVGRNKTVKG